MRLALLWLTLPACDDPCASRFSVGAVDTVTSGPLTFERTAIDAGLCGPAYVTASNLDDDPDLELAVSIFGIQTGASIPDGAITVYDRDGESWSPVPVLATDGGVKWPNEADPHDLDGDGDLDLLAGTGFLTCQLVPWTADCGGISWYENGAGWARHDVVPPGADGFYHRPLPTDVDGDGVLDLVATRESLATPFGSATFAQLEWFRGTADGYARAGVLSDGGGSLPQLWDIDGDGDDDIVSGEYFVEQGGFVWFEKDGADYTRHVISTDFGPAIQLSVVPDLFGDGAPVLVGSNHVNDAEGSTDIWPPAIIAWRFPADPTGAWAAEVLADDFDSLPGTGVAAPGVFSWGDVEGDGDIDLLVAGDGDVALYWLEQDGGAFTQHVLEAELPTAGGNVVADVDADGAMDLLAVGYEDNVVLRWEVR